MRIVENTPSRLVLRDRTLWVSVFCFGAAFALLLQILSGHPDRRALIPAGLFAAFGLLFLRATDVVFDKARRLCLVVRLDLFRRRRRTISFDEIVDILVEPAPVADDAAPQS